MIQELLDAIDGVNDNNYVHIASYNGSTTTLEAYKDVTYGTGLFGFNWTYIEKGSPRIDVGDLRTGLEAAKAFHGSGSYSAAVHDSVASSVKSILSVETGSNAGSAVKIWITAQP